MSGKDHVLNQKCKPAPNRKRAIQNAERKGRQRKRNEAELDNVLHCDAVDTKIRKRKIDHRKGLTKKGSFKIALAKFDRNQVPPNNIGKMNVPCRRGCGALHFRDESTASICCDKDGMGSHRFLKPIPKFMETLLQDAEFRRGIRHYNNTFQIATIGSTLGPKSFQVHASFPYYIKVHGSIYHSLPPMVPDQGKLARFGQLYVIDHALDDIVQSQTSLDPQLVFRFHGGKEYVIPIHLRHHTHDPHGFSVHHSTQQKHHQTKMSHHGPWNFKNMLPTVNL